MGGASYQIARQKNKSKIQSMNLCEYFTVSLRGGELCCEAVAASQTGGSFFLSDLGDIVLSS
jgi:hypothetical protein